MGPLDKLRAFGLSISDIPHAAYLGIKDELSPLFEEHATDYNSAADQLYKHYGSHNVLYNKAKGFYGGLDYMLRYKRSQDDAAKLARLYQYKQSVMRGLFSDPKQDLIDLSANLDGINYAAQHPGTLQPTMGPLDPDNWNKQMQMAQDYAAGDLK